MNPRLNVQDAYLAIEAPFLKEATKVVKKMSRLVILVIGSVWEPLLQA